MNTLIKKSTIAVAVSVALGSSAAWAGPLDPSNEASTYNDTSVSLYKDVSVTKDLNLSGDVAIKGLVQVDSSAMATVDNKQTNYGNKVSTGDVQDPTFTSTTNSVSGNDGNLGVNVTAGIYNQQDNAAAIASFASPAQAAGTDYLGSADAEVFSNQNLSGKADNFYPGTVDQASTDSSNYGNRYDVDLVGAVFDATTGSIDTNNGNIGINASAGVSNLQKNSLAIALGNSGLSEASSATLQETAGLSTQVTAAADAFGNVAVSTYTATLGDVTGNAGNIGVNLASGSSNLQANSLSLAVVNNTTPIAQP